MNGPNSSQALWASQTVTRDSVVSSPPTNGNGIDSKLPPCFGQSQETYEEMDVITCGFFFFFFPVGIRNCWRKGRKGNPWFARTQGMNLECCLSRPVRLSGPLGPFFGPVHIFMLYNWMATEASLISLPQPFARSLRPPPFHFAPISLTQWLS